MAEPKKYVDVPVTKRIKLKVQNLLKELQAKGENVKTEECYNLSAGPLRKTTILTFFSLFGV
jgi:hypothetical protein